MGYNIGNVDNTPRVNLITRVNKEIKTSEAPFKPYFFIESSKDRVFAHYAARLGNRVSIEKSDLKMLDETPVSLVKTDIPKEVALLRDRIKGVTALEADIPFRRRVMIDMGINVCRNYDVAYWDTEYNEETKKLKEISLVDFRGKEYSYFADTEEEIPEISKAFLAKAEEYDLIGGYNSDLFDIVEFEKVLRGCGLQFPRHIVWLDLMWTLKGALRRKLSSWKLKYVAEKLLNETRFHCDKKIKNSTQSEIEERCIQDSKLLLLLDQKYNLSRLCISKASLTYLIPDEVNAASRCIDSLLLREARQLGYVLPCKPKIKDVKKHSGAIVLQPPKPFLIYENVVVIDFASMYPNIIIKYGISPDPRKKLFPNMIQTMIGERLEWKKKWKEAKESQNKEGEDAAFTMQWALKILMNAMYGYFSFRGSRVFRNDLGDEIATRGRDLLSGTMGMLEELGMDVIYGDTDSIFCKLPMKITRENLDILTEKLNALLRERIGLDFTVESDIYEKLYFPMSASKSRAPKKRYAAMLTDGTVEIVGLEAIRSDYPEVAREMQKSVIESYLNGTRIEDISIRVAEFKKKLFSGSFSPEDLAVSKTIRSEKYKVRTQHVRAYEIAKKRGYQVSVGDKVRYVFTARGVEPLPEEGVAAENAPIDYKHYWEHVFSPIFERALGVKILEDRRLDELWAQS